MPAITLTSRREAGVSILAPLTRIAARISKGLGERLPIGTARVLGLGALTAALGLACLAPPAAAYEDEAKSKVREVRVDVVENPARFVFARAPVFEDGLPAYGNSFITQGYIYPEGFLDSQTGVDAQGRPTRPEQVLGEWTCRGFFVGNGFYTESGAIVITTQVFDFYERAGWDPQADKSPGARTVVTEGIERVDGDMPFKRAVTGGTGPYAGARGEDLQRFLGFEDEEAMNVRQRHRIRLLGWEKAE